MESGKKAAIGATVLLFVVAGVRFGMIYRERHAPEVPVAKVEAKSDPDDLVFLKQMRPDSIKDIRELVGKPLWISAGGQLDFYPYAGHRANYAKSDGVLLGAQEILVKDVIEQVAPKSATFRIPGGDRQVLLVFSMPKSKDPAAEYAVPVGYHQDGAYTFETDEIFFYDDPHLLYKYWTPQQWSAIDEHRVIAGMNERQVQLALGQVSKSLSNDYGNRLVLYSNLGHPIAVTFVKDKLTSWRPNDTF